MELILQGHRFRYETENICRLFLPHETIHVCDALSEDITGGVVAYACLQKEAAHTQVSARVVWDDFDETITETLENTCPTYTDICELTLCTLLYRLFVRLFGFEQSWGIVTGVRPVKLLRHLVKEQGEEAALRYFRETLLVNDQKLSLCRNTLHTENKLLALSKPESFSLYISIPFCPTRCDYCSFVSRTVERAGKLIPAYVDALCEEIAHTGRIARELGLRLETVYFGGGTPTSLEAADLARLIDTVGRHFDLSYLREYTVEAGRPDTVTVEKLRTLKEGGVTRISINPQTLQQHVLNAIGRKHTVEQFYTAFDMARQCGHTNINTDLIAGLPNDTYEGFCETLNGILALSPESVTVHTLSMKRASNLVIGHRADYRGGNEAAEMVSFSGKALTQGGYHPYYLYRQSRCVGGQENVGWSKPDYEGLYNVFIMDETHTILGCGAGAVTKLKQPNENYLERIFNYKFPYEYNTGLAELLRRKEQVIAFYEQYGVRANTER